MDPDQVGSNLRVGDLMSSEGDKWDTEKVNATFSEEDAHCIISLPIFPTREDRLIWHFDKKGIYNVRSGYFVASRMDNVSDPIPGVSWNKVWSMQIPPKVKVFLWRALRNILPTKEKLNQRGVQIDPLCGCGEEMETLDHAIMRCRCVQTVWKGWVRVGGVVQGSLQEAFAQLCSRNDAKAVAEFAMVAWAIWWARNVRVWQNSSMTPNAVLKKALGHLKEWERVRCMQSSQVQNQDSGSRGDRTQVEWLGEVDAAIVKDPEGMGSGAVFCKADGVFLKAVSSSKQWCFSPCMAEALALRDCLRMAESHLPGRGLVLSDAQSIVMAVANEDPDWSELGGVILECKDVLCRRQDIKVEWTSRSNVRSAHVLARNASLYGSCKIWGGKAPMYSLFGIVMNYRFPSKKKKLVLV